MPPTTLNDEHRTSNATGGWFSTTDYWLGIDLINLANGKPPTDLLRSSRPMLKRWLDDGMTMRDVIERLIYATTQTLTRGITADQAGTRIGPAPKKQPRSHLYGTPEYERQRSHLRGTTKTTKPPKYDVHYDTRPCDTPVRITTSALDELRNEIDQTISYRYSETYGHVHSAIAVETGGCIGGISPILSTEEVLVCDAIFAGYDQERTRMMLDPDAFRRWDATFRRSSERNGARGSKQHRVIGSWHLHPTSTSNEPSCQDMQAWCSFLEIAQRRNPNLMRQVDLILTPHPEQAYRQPTVHAFITIHDERTGTLTVRPAKEVRMPR